MPSVMREKKKLSDAVQQFSNLMLMKLYQKAHQGYSGWNDDGHYEYLQQSLLDHAAEGAKCGNWRRRKSQLLDTANLAMFLYFMELDRNS